MWELSMPFRLAHRINIELNGLMEESQSKGSNFCDLFGAWFWFKEKKTALSNICLLLLCMPSSPCTLPIFQDGPEGWTYNKPFVWYQFPYPAVYHGPASATPAKLRLDAGIPASSSRYLWAWSGTGRGNAAALRKVLMAECSRCTRLLRECIRSFQTFWYPVSSVLMDLKLLPSHLVECLFKHCLTFFFWGGFSALSSRLSARCGKVTKISEVTGSPQQSQIKDYEALSAIKLQSIFCPEPPGDSVTRKSLLDSIVLGCIPIIFVHQELDMFEAFVTAEEFAEAVLYVPEAEILGSEGKISLWGTGTFHEMSKTWRRFKKLYPRSASVFDALAPHHTKEQRETRIRELFPKNRSMLDILTSMSEEEIHEKQRALAKISHRFVIGLDDSSEDSVRILLNRIESNDALVAQRNRESTLSF